MRRIYSPLLLSIMALTFCQRAPTPRSSEPPTTGWRWNNINNPARSLHPAQPPTVEQQKGWRFPLDSYLAPPNSYVAGNKAWIELFKNQALTQYSLAVLPLLNLFLFTMCECINDLSSAALKFWPTHG